MEGIVIKSTGSWYEVLDTSNRQWNCRLRGRLKVSGIRSTNPVAVGDRVVFEAEDNSLQGIISEILPRRNYVIRKATNLSKQTHIIAANLDQAVLIATLAHPRTSAGFIDRLLVTCEAYSIPALIVWNKHDLVHERTELDSIIKTYRDIGYDCLETSVQTEFGLDQLAGILKDKTSLLAGHSGVGKSSLINAIQPGLELRVQSLSKAHAKGKHTTTFAEMFALDQGGFIIDTPGIKEFGLAGFEAAEISHFFPEMRALFNQCRFDNCTHINEPGCMVLQRLEEGAISRSRYASYVNMFSGQDTRA